MTDQGYQDDIDVVVFHLREEFSIDVTFGNDEINAYWYATPADCISVSTKQKKRLQLYCLLHEAGHAIIRMRDNYDTLYPYGAKEKSKTISRRADVVREEIVAWDEGEKLTRQLGIKLDYKLWHNFSKKHIFEYIKWAHDPDNYKISGLIDE